MDSDCIGYLFLTHPSTIELLRAFSRVLIMDCTCAYKIIRYNLLLLEIVGVTLTDLKFSVCCVYLEFELEDNYI